MQQQMISQRKVAKCREGLKRLLDKCSHLRSDLHQIKNFTFKAKRKVDLNIKTVRDTLRNATKKQHLRSFVKPAAQEDKENNPMAMNSLKQIQVQLPKANALNEQNTKPRDQDSEPIEHDNQLSEKIKLQLQEIRLLEQRENLIRKKNERLNTYYSENKKELELKRSQVLEG